MDQKKSYTYRNTWASAKLDRIIVTVPKGQKDVIRQYAIAHGESLSGYIVKCIYKDMSGKSGE